MSHHAAMLSDATSVPSPTPFSPFSSYSTVSEATVVSDGQADLGAFTTVFFALSQLQLQHHSGHSPRDSGNPINEILLGGSSNSTLPNTPLHRPYSMSPLSLDRMSSRMTPQRSTPSDNVDSADTESVDAKSDTALTASSAAEDGDEESLDALTSPHSQSSSDPPSVLDEDDKDEKLLEYDPSRGWTYTEISPYQATFHQSSTSSDSPTSGSPQLKTLLSLASDEDGPTLGEFSSAFEFFAAERAKLAKQLDATKSNGDTPTSLSRSLPKSSPNKKGKKAAKSSKKKGTAKLAPGNAAVRLVAHFGSSGIEEPPGKSTATASGANPLGPSPPSSDDLNEAVDTRKKLPRGMLPRPPKQILPTSKSYQSGMASASKVSAPMTIPNNPRRPANHRHTRSLPVNAQTLTSVPMPLSSDAVVRIKSLARRLTFQFPSDAPSLRRVIANPEAALGFGSHATPSDDALVAGGFYEPVYGADGMTPLYPSSSASQDALLYIFIDHSNILVGYLEWLKKQNPESFPGGKRPSRPKLSHAALVLLLARGRQCMRKVLIASSPLHQSLDEIAGMGYQISVLQRVEIKEGAPGTPPPRTLNNQRWKNRKGAKSATNGPDQTVGSARATNSGSSTESDSGGQKLQPSTAVGLSNRATQRTATQHHRRTTSEQVLIKPSTTSNHLASVGAELTPIPAGAPLSSSPPTRPRFREEAVDELLQLKLLQTLLDSPSPPPPGSTIVLASGDAARSQFNPQGFLGCVRKAVERGWKVEVVGWDEGRSRAYGELMAEVERGEVGRDVGGSLSIIGLDRWGVDLVEV